MRLHLRFPLSVERSSGSAAETDPPDGTVPQPPAGLDFVYESAVDVLASQQQMLSSLDSRAGVLIGATAAAFGLIASGGGGTASLFARHQTLTVGALFVLAVAFLCLLLAVRVRDYVEVPGLPALVSLADVSAWRIKELSLDAVQRAWQSNRRQLVRKGGFLLAGQVLIGFFVALVMLAELAEVGPPLLRAADGWRQTLPR